MLKQNKSIIFAVIICLLTVIFAFQNCAEPLDPALLDNNSEELPSLPGAQEALSFESYITPLEVEEGEPVYISTEIFKSSGQETFEIYKNGERVSSSQYYEVASVNKGDSFKVIVTDGTVVKEQALNLTIVDGSTNPNPNPTGQVVLKNISGTKSFTKYFINDGESINFSVEIDFTQSDAQYASAVINWEMQGNGTGAEAWVYHSGSRDLNISGNYRKVAQNFQAVAKFNGQVVGKSKTISVITRKYNSTSTVCARPYVMSGIHSYSRVAENYCVPRGNRDNDCDPAVRYHNNIKTVSCSLAQDKSDRNNYISVGTSTPHTQHKGSWSYCNGETTRKTSLVNNILVSTIRSLNVTYSCGGLALGNKDVLATRTLETLTQGQTRCPDYEYVVGFHRHSNYPKGQIERLKCAEIED